MCVCVCVCACYGEIARILELSTSHGPILKTNMLCSIAYYLPNLMCMTLSYNEQYRFTLSLSIIVCFPSVRLVHCVCVSVSVSVSVCVCVLAYLPIIAPY